jgi:tetratricopeptide (TPR) repeat protein
MNDLGEALRSQQDHDCVSFFGRSFELSKSLGRNDLAATAAFDLGLAYLSIPTMRDFDAADTWFQHAFALYPEEMPTHRASCLGFRAEVQYQLCFALFSNGLPIEMWRPHFDTANTLLNRAFTLLPSDPEVKRARGLHNQFGAFLLFASHFEKNDKSRRQRLLDAESHFRAALRMAIESEKPLAIATFQGSLTRVLYQQDRFDHALDFARAALANYESAGDPEPEQSEYLRRLILCIESAKEKENNP